MHSGSFLVFRHPTRLALLVLVAAVCLFAGTVGKASAGNTVAPADQASLQSSPVDFRGSASLDFLTYAPGVSLELFRYEEQVQGCFDQPGDPCYDPFGLPLTGVMHPAGTASGGLGLSGDWNIPVGSLENRSVDFSPAPDGTPLEDGRYHLRVTQANHSAGGSDAVWETDFWVDSKAPDTVLQSQVPADQYTPGPRSFKYYALRNGYSHGQSRVDAGSPTDLECRVDGGGWHGLNTTPSDPPEEFNCHGVATLDPDLVGRYAEYTVNAADEGWHSFEARARDAAGNVDPTPLRVDWLIDRTAPEITINEPSMRERYVLGQHVPSNFSCDDPPAGSPPGASGIRRCQGPATVDTSRLGNFTFTVNAEDRAGNTSSKTHSYAVDPPRYPDLVGGGSPIAYYRLGDPLGATAMTDSSGSHRDGEYMNGIALERPSAPNCERRPHQPHTCDLTADPENSSAFFPARDGYGFTNSIVAPQTGYTLEAWINRADSGAGSIVGQGGAGQLFVNADGKLALRQTQDTVTSSGPVLTPGQWFHVAATWNGSVARLYVNGSQVGSSSSANKAPSGSATLYVGYGDQAPWFHGRLDEVAYFGKALSGGTFATRYAVGTAHDVSGPVNGPPIQRPDVHILTPPDGALYAPTKTPALDFSCSDLDGNATVADCDATVDGSPAANGSGLPDAPGAHTVSVTAVDDSGLARTHASTYYVRSFQDIYNADDPIVYYRLGDPVGAGTMADSSGNHRNGTFRNAQDSGPAGISGDGDRARRFLGSGGYGFANNITAPTTQGSMEAWVNPDVSRDQSVIGHGDAGEIYIENGVFKFRHMGTTVAADLGPVPGRFTQVAAVWDGVTIAIYVDGELHGQTEATRRPSSSSTLYVGFGEIKPWFKGSLDEVAYYGTALTSARVLEHFLADPPAADEIEAEEPRPTGPVGNGNDPVSGEEPPSPDGQPGNNGVRPIGAPAENGRAARKAKAKMRAKARARANCRKLGKAKKRRACLRRVNRR